MAVLKKIIWIIFPLICLYFLVLGYSLIQFWLSPMSLSAADLDKNGEVTFAELELASDFGKRAVSVDGEACQEYFLKKDGVVLEVIC